MSRTIIVDAQLRPSRALVVLLAVVHLAAAVSPWLAGLPGWASVAIAGLVIGWGVRQIWSVGRLGDPEAILRFQLAGDGRMILHRRGTEPTEAECQGFELLGPWGCIVSYRAPDQRLSRLLVWRDQCDERTLRRLRIAARWHAGVAAKVAARPRFADSRDVV